MNTHGKQCIPAGEQLPVQCRHTQGQRRVWKCFSAGKKGFGKQAPPAPTQKASQKTKLTPERQYHKISSPKLTTDLDGPAPEAPPNSLIELFLSIDEKLRPSVAEYYAESLTEQFFLTADFLLKKAENDRYDMAIYALKDTIRCAMEVRSQKLRPELRFLNKLLMLDSLSARIPVLQDKSTLEMIKGDDGYVFKTLDKMISDVEAGMQQEKLGVDKSAQQEKPSAWRDQQALHEQLLETRQELKALLESSTS